MKKCNFTGGNLNFKAGKWKKVYILKQVNFFFCFTGGREAVNLDCRAEKVWIINPQFPASKLVFCCFAAKTFILRRGREKWVYIFQQVNTFFPLFWRGYTLILGQRTGGKHAVSCWKWENVCHVKDFSSILAHFYTIANFFLKSPKLYEKSCFSRFISSTACFAENQGFWRSIGDETLKKWSRI